MDDLLQPSGNKRKKFKALRFVFMGIKNLNRDAALDSARNVLAVLGVGTVVGDFASKMPIYFMVPALLFLLGVWYLDYLRHDFHPAQTALENAEACRGSLDILAETSRG